MYKKSVMRKRGVAEMSDAECSLTGAHLVELTVMSWNVSWESTRPCDHGFANWEIEHGSM